MWRNPQNKRIDPNNKIKRVCITLPMNLARIVDEYCQLTHETFSRIIIKTIDWDHMYKWLKDNKAEILDKFLISLSSDEKILKELKDYINVEPSSNCDEPSSDCEEFKTITNPDGEL